MIYKNRGIKYKFLRLGAAICLISLLLVSITSYIIAYNITKDQSDRRIEATAQKNSTELNDWFQQYGDIVNYLAEDIEIMGNYNQEYLQKLTTEKLNTYNNEVLDIYMGFQDTEKLISGRGWQQPKDFDCHVRNWYKQALDKDEVIYTEPYIDADTKKMVITVAKKINRNGTLFGVLAADIVVNNLIDNVKKYNPSNKSYVILMDKQYDFLVHPKKDFVYKGENYAAKKIGWKGYLKLNKSIDKSNIRKINIKDYDGKDKYFILSNIKSTDWTFGIVITKFEYEKPLNKLLIGFIIALIISFIIAFYIMIKFVNIIVQPIKSLNDSVKRFTNKEMWIRNQVLYNDEIGELGKSFNNMADTIEEYSIYLEKKVFERTKELKDRNDKILESIDYAQRLQSAILPNISERLKISEENYFVIWKPKDIVGGDVYWCRETDNYFILILADCTGHGVPGALMSMALCSILDGLIHEIKNISKPSEVLYKINFRLKETLGEDRSESIINDGADMAVLLIDKNNNKVIFSGAKLPMYLLHKGEIITYKASKNSVGYSWHKEVIYEDVEIDLDNEDIIYLTTDGLLDQNIETGKGGIGKARFIRFINEISDKSMENQKLLIENFINERLAKVEQRDDITVLGFKL